MIVERRSLLDGAADARGMVIVIDVLRAFSCSALMFHYGVRDLALVRTPEEALAFRNSPGRNAEWHRASRDLGRDPAAAQGE